MTANQNLQSFEKVSQPEIKVIPLADELNRLQSQLGGLRRQTGRLSDSGLRITINPNIRRK